MVATIKQGVYMYSVKVHVGRRTWVWRTGFWARREDVEIYYYLYLVLSQSGAERYDSSFISQLAKCLVYLMFCMFTPRVGALYGVVTVQSGRHECSAEVM